MRAYPDDIDVLLIRFIDQTHIIGNRKSAKPFHIA